MKEKISGEIEFRDRMTLPHVYITKERNRRRFHLQLVRKAFISARHDRCA